MKFIEKSQWLAVFVLWLYIVYRGVSIEITQDEAYSYFIVKTNYFRAFPGTYNTHWLNSLFMKLFLLLPGRDHLWKLRALSMLSWLLYAYSVIKLTNSFRRRVAGLFFFSAAVFNPFLLFYFSLARGYGVAAALIIFCFWRAKKLIDVNDTSIHKWLKVFLPAALAVTANFSALYFFIALTQFYMIYLASAKQLKSLLLPTAFRWRLLIAGIFLFAAGCLLFIKLYTREPEFGTTKNIAEAVFGSLLSKMLYLNIAAVSTGALAVLLFSVLAALTAIGWRQFYSGKSLSLSIFVTCTVSLVITTNFIFHISFGSSYLFERTAVIFYAPLLLAPICFLDQSKINQVYTRRLLSGGGYIATVFIFFNFYSSINIEYFYEWPIQSKTKECLDYLSGNGARNVGMDLWQFSVHKNYYSKAFPDMYQFKYSLINGNNLSDSTEKGIFSGYDYFLLSKLPAPVVQNPALPVQYAVPGASVIKNNIHRH